MSTRATIQQFVESMTQLMALLRREIEVLKARDYDTLEDIQRTKTMLGKTYDSSQEALRKDLSVLDSLSAEERSELRQLYARFRETLSENMLAIKAAQDATDKAVKLVIDGVKKARGINGEPSKPGRPARGYAAYGNGSATSFAINRTT